MRWFTSDTHFYHKNIIKFCRPEFDSVEEMNRHLVESWNSVVGDEDTVFHLGDVAFAGTAKTFDIIDRLKGYKVLIKGNHDLGRSKMKARGFDEVHDSLHLWDDAHDRPVYLSHKPRYDKLDEWALCGHVHQRWARVGNTVNVGVDVWGYWPITLEKAFKALPQEVELDYH